MKARTRTAESTFSALRAAEKVCAANLASILFGATYSDALVLRYTSETEGEHTVVLTPPNTEVRKDIPAYVARLNANPYRTLALSTGNSVSDLRLRTVLREHRRLMESAHL